MNQVKIDLLDRYRSIFPIQQVPETSCYCSPKRPDLVRNLRPPIAEALALVADLAEVVAAGVGTQDLGCYLRPSGESSVVPT